MLTSDQIAEGITRLDSGKLTDRDVDQTDSILKMFFGDLVDKYSYEFKSKLAAFDDTGNTTQICAQIGACLNQMEELGFGVSNLQGGSDALFYKEKDEYWQYVEIIFLKMYNLPLEMSSWDLKRRQAGGVGASTGTISSCRVERSRGINEISEARLRRRWW